MEVNDVIGAASATTANQDENGFAALNADVFMELLITQLQNQDPLEPVGNDELLSQLSMMRNLQSNIELGDTVKAITSNQQLSTAATFIGKSVTGTATNDQQISGTAERAFLRNGEAYLGVGNSEIPLSNVSEVIQSAS
jgi:flagellar basal-body rod modification protein FlgD